MAKEVAGQIKLQIKGGAANPSPPVGPALGSKGINIMEFCKQIQRQNPGQGGQGIACNHYLLLRQVFRFYHQDSSCSYPVARGCQD